MLKKKIFSYFFGAIQRKESQTRQSCGTANKIKHARYTNKNYVLGMQKKKLAQPFPSLEQE